MPSDVTPTPEAREREAEAELRRHMAGEYASDAEDKAVASFRTAVRAALVAEMVAGVEKMPPRDAAYDDTMRLACVEFFRADVTCYLHGLAPETDR